MKIITIVILVYNCNSVAWRDITIVMSEHLVAWIRQVATLSDTDLPKYLQIRQFIGQDLFTLESCFTTQKEFNSYTLQAFKWNYAMCHLYIAYYQFLNDYPVFVYSGLPWTTIRNDCNRWRNWLDSDESKQLPTSDYTSSSFWRGALPPYRENHPESEPRESPASFHSFEDDNQDGSNFGSEMVLSTSLSNLNL